MQNFSTETEKKLWGWLYKSQIALAKLILKQEKEELEKDGVELGMTTGELWSSLSGTSKSKLMRKAIKESGIDSKEFLEIIRNNIDALTISENIQEEDEK